MGSLGEESARVRVRRLRVDEAYLLGALHLQALRRRGTAPATAHVPALAAAWGDRAADLPAWVAECDEQHVGLALCRLPALPRIGPGVPELLVLEPLAGPGPEPVALALARSVVAWAGQEGHARVEVAPDVSLPGAVLDAARADVLAARRVSLPTRP